MLQSCFSTLQNVRQGGHHSLQGEQCMLSKTLHISWPPQATEDLFAKRCHHYRSLGSSLPSPLTELWHQSQTHGKKQSSKAGLLLESKIPSRACPERGTGTRRHQRMLFTRLSSCFAQDVTCPEPKITVNPAQGGQVQPLSPTLCTLSQITQMPARATRRTGKQAWQEAVMLTSTPATSPVAPCTGGPGQAARHTPTPPSPAGPVIYRALAALRTENPHCSYPQEQPAEPEENPAQGVLHHLPPPPRTGSLCLRGCGWMRRLCTKLGGAREGAAAPQAQG